MPQSYCEAMQCVLVISEDMLEKAINNQWDDVEVMEITRQKLLKSDIALPSDQDEVERSAELISQIIYINDKLAALGSKKLVEYSLKKRELGQGRKAVAAYGR